MTDKANKSRKAEDNTELDLLSNLPISSGSWVFIEQKQLYMLQRRYLLADIGIAVPFTPAEDHDLTNKREFDFYHIHPGF